MSIEQIAYGSGGGLVGAITLVLIYLKKANNKVSKDTCAATHKAVDDNFKDIKASLSVIETDVKEILKATNGERK